MKLKRPYKLSEIGEILDCKMVGSPDHEIKGINEIHKVEEGDLVFSDHPKYIQKALKSAATTILTNQEVDCPPGKALLISDQPFRDFNQLTQHFSPEGFWEEVNQKVGNNSKVHPSVSIGNNVVIGKNCKIHPNVTIYENCIIGDYVEIHANTVIGGMAFYYQKKEGVFHRMHTCGRVVIGNHVEIGTHCSIDRGVTGDTIIGAGTKIDNQVQVGHDTVIGENCLFASQVGVAGCVVIGNNVTLWGQVGVKSDIIIEDNVTIAAQSGVQKDCKEGIMYFGSPAGEARTKFKELAAMKRLPEILEHL